MILWAWLSGAGTRGGRHDKVGSASSAFDFFSFSRVEIAVAKGADCWIILHFDERTWGVGCQRFFLPIFITKKCEKM
jgi:hypothetical protein